MFSVNEQLDIMSLRVVGGVLKTHTHNPNAYGILLTVPSNVNGKMCG